MSKLNQLNLKVLVPMYFDDDNLEDIFERANSLGMDSLTEDEQYFMDNYSRLFDFMEQLSSAEIEELENATDNDEVYNKYSNAEMNDKQITVTMVGDSEDTAVNLIHKVMNGKYDERNNKRDSKKLNKE